MICSTTSLSWKTASNTRLGLTKSLSPHWILFLACGHYMILSGPFVKIPPLFVSCWKTRWAVVIGNASNTHTHIHFHTKLRRSDWDTECLASGVSDTTWPGDLTFQGCKWPKVQHRTSFEENTSKRISRQKVSIGFQWTYMAFRDKYPTKGLKGQLTSNWKW